MSARSSNQFLLAWFQSIRYQSILFQSKIDLTKVVSDDESQSELIHLLHCHRDVTKRSGDLLKKMFVTLLDPIRKDSHTSRISALPLAKMFDPSPNPTCTVFSLHTWSNAFRRSSVAIELMAKMISTAIKNECTDDRRYKLLQMLMLKLLTENKVNTDNRLSWARFELKLSDLTADYIDDELMYVNPAQSLLSKLLLGARAVSREEKEIVIGSREMETIDLLKDIGAIFLTSTNLMAFLHHIRDTRVRLIQRAQEAIQILLTPSNAMLHTLNLQINVELQRLLNINFPKTIVDRVDEEQVKNLTFEQQKAFWKIVNHTPWRKVRFARKMDLGPCAPGKEIMYQLESYLSREEALDIAKALEEADRIRHVFIPKLISIDWNDCLYCCIGENPFHRDASVICSQEISTSQVEVTPNEYPGHPN